MAFTPCTAEMTANVTVPGNSPRIKGYEKIGVLINKNDVSWSTITQGANKRNVLTMPLLSGKKTAVICNCRKNPLPFNGTQTSYNRDADAYDKVVQFYYEDAGATASKGVVEPLKDGEYIVILERKDKNGDRTFPVYGFQKGLSCGNDGGAQVQDEETGYWLMTMATQEPWAELSFGDPADTYAENKALFDALVALAY